MIQYKPGDMDHMALGQMHVVKRGFDGIYKIPDEDIVEPILQMDPQQGVEQQFEPDPISHRQRARRWAKYVVKHDVDGMYKIPNEDIMEPIHQMDPDQGVEQEFEPDPIPRRQQARLFLLLLSEVMSQRLIFAIYLVVQMS